VSSRKNNMSRRDQ